MADPTVPPGPGGPPRPSAETDRRWLEETVQLSRECPNSATAFAVGAVVVGGDGRVLATGYSREGHPHDHAEEAALAKIPRDDPRLASATIYSSLEPCSARASRPRSCTELILASGIRRVVFAWREPDVFVDCIGAETLREAGVEVVEIPEVAARAREINAHLFGP
jgi:pyrimidine deaminase RibD-like protein